MTHKEAKTGSKSWARVLFLQDPLTDSELALHCQQPGSQHCSSGTKDSPQENQSISQQFTGRTEDVMKILEKVTYSIHVVFMTPR
jgi:hypothetical protein